MKLFVGDKAPDFSLMNQDGKLIRLSDYIGKQIVLLAFYPGDFTSVCTKEMVCFREDFSEFSNLNCKILGISCDSIEKHKEFVQKYKFPFDLLADSKAEVSELYDVKMPFVNKSNRAIFILDSNGQIGYAHKEKLPVFKRTNQELLEAIQNIS